MVLAGVAIAKGGDPSVRANRLRDDKGSGVRVGDGGRGTLEDNVVMGNAEAFVIDDSFHPTLGETRRIEVPGRAVRAARQSMTVGPSTVKPAGSEAASSSASSARRGSTSRSIGRPSASRGTATPAASSQRA